MKRILLAVVTALVPALAVVAQVKPAEPKDQPKEQPKEEPKDPPKAETVDEFLKRIEDAHKEHKDFQGKFDQVKYVPLFGDEIKSGGRFAFKKPDHVRWEYTQPHKSVLVVTGDTGKKWSEATGRVEAFNLGDDRGLDAVVKQLFTWFKGEFTKLKDDYEVSILEAKPGKLKLTPKKDIVKKFIAAIEVAFAEKGDQITSVKIIEPMQEGDEEAGYTLYTFKDAELDKGVADSEFELSR